MVCPVPHIPARIVMRHNSCLYYVLCKFWQCRR